MFGDDTFHRRRNHPSTWQPQLNLPSIQLAASCILQSYETDDEMQEGKRTSIQNTYEHRRSFTSEGRWLTADYIHRTVCCLGSSSVTAYRPGSSLRSACWWWGPEGCTGCGNRGGLSPRRGGRSGRLHPLVCFPTCSRGDN